MKLSRLIAFGGTVIIAAAVMVMLFTALRSPIVQAAPAGNGGATVQGISAGGNHACAQMSNGRLLCWGSNGSGRLGDGTTTPYYMPVDVVSVTSGASSVAAGGVMSLRHRQRWR